MNNNQKGHQLTAYLITLLGLAFAACPASYASQTVKPEANKATQQTKQDATSDQPPAAIPDPYEKFNRSMFTFNDKLDKLLLKPVATLYNAVMPKPLNMGVHNFFNNLGEVPTIANDILQLHFYQMSNDIWRLGINTTVGVGGLFDVATRMNLPYYSNDFGLTMSYWGYRNSTYLVLPFFGPNTVRDGLGIPVDYYAFSVYQYINSTSLSYGLYGLGVVDHRAQLLQYQSVFEEAAIDKYVFMRSAYMQRRNYQIEKNQRLGTEYRAAKNSEQQVPQENYNNV